MKEKQAKNETKRRWTILLGVIVLAVVVFGSIKTMHTDSAVPVLTIETPQKLSASETDTFVLDVSISAFGEALYPAASMSISFDSSCLEFLGAEEGNVFVLGEANAAGAARQLPEWSCNPEQCNKNGMINIMYLDLTGGKHAFTKELLAEDDNVVIRLRFRLHGSARAGDVYDLIVEDAVFAASDENMSLATTKRTLKTKNSRVVIGE